MPLVDPTWDTPTLVKELCDILVAKGHLKEKPAFIRADREAKIVSIFESVGLDGAKMASFDNPGPLEMLLRKGTNGEVWVAQVQAALISMLPESAAKAAKKMGMDEATKAELQSAHEKTLERRDRLEQAEGEGGRTQDREGKGRDKGGDGKGRWSDDAEGGDDRRGGRDGGKGRGWNRDDADGGDRRGGRDGGRDGGEGGRWDGGKGSKGGGRETMECFNCGGLGHSARDCPEPRKDKGKGRRDRSERICDNCGKPGHKSRECPEPVDPAAVQRRLDAKAAREAAKGG